MKAFKGIAVAGAAIGLLAVGAGAAAADAPAEGSATGSAGVGSGNLIQVPAHVPINLCGNTVSVIGALNPASGNGCSLI